MRDSSRHINTYYRAVWVASGLLVSIASLHGQSLQGDLRPGARYERMIELAAGQAASIHLEKRCADAHIVVLFGDRKLREVFSTAYSVAPLEMVLLAENAGPHRVVLTNESKDPAANLHYSLTVGPIRQADEHDRQEWAAEEALYLPAAAQPPIDEALRRAREAAVFFESSGASYKRVSALRILGNLYLKRQDFAAAHEQYSAAAAILKASPWRFEAAAVGQNLSYTKSQLGDARGAIAELDSVLAIRSELKDDLGRGITLFGRAQFYWRLGELQRALDDYRISLAQFRKLNEPKWEATVLNAMGLLYVELGRPDTARSDYAEATAIWRRLNDKNGLMMTVNNLGLLKESQDLHAEARSDFEEAIRLAGELGDRQARAYILQNLGDVSANEGKHAQALKDYQASLDLKRELKDVRAAAETRRKIGLSELALGRMEQARASLNDALTDSRAVADRTGEAQSLAALAKFEDAAGSPRVAEARIGEAVKLIETTRTELHTRDLRTSYFSTQSDFYDFAIDLSMDKGGSGAAAALEWSERERARSLLDAVQRAGAGAQEPFASILTADQIRGLLGRGTVLVEYSVTPLHSYAWVVTPDQIRTVRLSEQTRIATAIMKLSKAIEPDETHLGGAEQRDRADAALAELAGLIWWPLEIGEGHARVVITGSGGLERVPFAALPASPGGPRLLERMEVASVPSASIVAAIHRAETGYPKNVAVFADPVFSSADLRIEPAHRGEAEYDELTRLRFSREEAAGIVHAAGGADARQWLDFSATVDNLRRAAAEPGAVLHLATHAIVDGHDPAASRLVLSRLTRSGSSQPSELRLNDIYNLRIRRELVVLSACRTAAGTEVKGEGLLSLTRAFLYAGAKGVIANLWKVDDRASAELMRRFYEGLLGKHRTPPEALRLAQLSMLHDARWSGTANWASYLFVGDWRIEPWGQAE